MFCMRAMQTKDDAWRSLSFFFLFLFLNHNDGYDDQQYSSSPTAFLEFLVSVFPCGLWSFLLVIRSYGVEISWACAGRITSFLLFLELSAFVSNFFFFLIPAETINQHLLHFGYTDWKSS